MAKRGPNTKAGKAIASRNAVRHAVLSQSPVIPDVETEEDWQTHRTHLFDDLDPHGALEEALADQIAFTLWKLRRVAFYQAVKTRWHIDQAESDLALADAYAAGTVAKGEFHQPDSDRVYGAELLRMLPAADTLTKIMRYEAHLHRQYIQTLHELEAIQLRRQGGQSPLARLDISAPPVA